MHDPRNLWQKQEVEPVSLSVEELRARAAKFENRIRLRNLREQVACVAVVVMFGAMGLKTPQTVPRIAFALIIAGAIYIAWHIQKWGAPKGLPSDLGRANCVGFYRGELERQRNLLRRIWRWYLGPMVPGMSLLVMYGIWVARPERRWFPIAYAVAARGVQATYAATRVSLVGERLSEVSGLRRVDPRRCSEMSVLRPHTNRAGTCDYPRGGERASRCGRTRTS